MRSEVFMEWKGLSDSEVAKSREKYGTNALTHIPPEPLWVKVLNGFKDPMIVILLVALAVQLVLFLFVFGCILSGIPFQGDLNQFFG